MTDTDGLECPDALCVGTLRSIGSYLLRCEVCARVYTDKPEIERRNQK